jgi:hypothetical protein
MQCGVKLDVQDDCIQLSFFVLFLFFSIVHMSVQSTCTTFGVYSLAEMKAMDGMTILLSKPGLHSLLFLGQYLINPEQSNANASTHINQGTDAPNVCSEWDTPSIIG